ncbi:MAG: tetratricopeptide repeat protein [Aquaticitalea sp.]
MKTRIILVVAALLLGFNHGFAQQDEECMTNLTIFTDYYKSKKYNEAYEPWMKVRNKCPKFNRAIYAYGEKILKFKIENSAGAEKVALLNDLMKLWDEALVNFPSNYTKGGVLSDKGELMYDHKADLNATNKQIYDMLDSAFKEDKENFTSPRALYIYFSSIVDMQDAKEVEVQAVFDKYDDVSEKISKEIDNYTLKLNPLVEKEEAGTALTSKEGQYKASYESYLENYNNISGSMDTKMGQLANCENLIPLYEKSFEQNKTDAEWLQRAVSRMFNKECTDAPLYTTMVKAYDAASPSADTKRFVGELLISQGKIKEGNDYLDQSYAMETDPLKKAKRAYELGKSYKKKGQYASARTYFQNALKLSPSMGRAYLEIAQMYASSANDCGKDVFHKRAVYWLAADEARKASRVDGSLTSYANQLIANYDAKAPTKGDVFTQGNAGQSLSIGCWIGMSIKVPNL